MQLANNRNINDSLQKTLNTKSLYDMYLEFWSKEKRDEFRAKFSVDGKNTAKFVEFPENPEAFFVPRKQPYAVSVPCKLIESCPDYNRTDQIDPNSCVKNLEKYENKFVCEAADEDGNPITLWYDSVRNVFRTTRGNHRTIMALLASGQDATIEAYVKVHDAAATDDEMFMKEATSFDADNQEKGQNKISLYKGQLFNALSNPNAPQWPVEIYEYLDNLPTPIGIAGTNKRATVQLDGYSAVWRRMEAVKDDKNLADSYEKLTVVLNALVNYAIPVNKKTGVKDGTLKADCIEHMVIFKDMFSNEIGKVDDANGIDSFSEFVNYMFNMRHVENAIFDNLTMQTLTLNSSGIRVVGWHVANLCTLYNEFVKVKMLKKGHSNKDTHDSMVISNSIKSWKEFLDVPKMVPPSFRKAVESNLSDIYR
jgi:hypothetical protein